MVSIAELLVMCAHASDDKARKLTKDVRTRENVERKRQKSTKMASCKPVVLFYSLCFVAGKKCVKRRRNRVCVVLLVV